MSDKIMNLYVEAGCPEGELRQDRAIYWAGEEIERLKAEVERLKTENKKFAHAVAMNTLTIAELQREVSAYKEASQTGDICMFCGYPRGCKCHGE